MVHHRPSFLRRAREAPEAHGCLRTSQQTPNSLRGRKGNQVTTFSLFQHQTRKSKLQGPNMPITDEGRRFQVTENLCCTLGRSFSSCRTRDTRISAYCMTAAGMPAHTALWACNLAFENAYVDLVRVCDARVSGNSSFYWPVQVKL